MIEAIHYIETGHKLLHATEIVEEIEQKQNLWENNFAMEVIFFFYLPLGQYKNMIEYHVLQVWVQRC